MKLNGNIWFFTIIFFNIVFILFYVYQYQQNKNIDFMIENYLFHSENS